MITQKRPPRSFAFTLVELLVVIGIIAVLIAILLPALSRAREQANRIKCAANLHAMGHALSYYTQQYGFYPGCSMPGPAGDVAVWPARLLRFMNNDKRVFFCPSQDPRCEWTGAVSATARVATIEYTVAGYDPGEPMIGITGTYFSYGYNGWGTGGPTTYDCRGFGEEHFKNPSISPPLKASRVKSPSEMIAIADTVADGMYDHIVKGQATAGAGPKPWWPATVHNGGANVLFCDGHVQRYLQRELLFDENTGPPFDKYYSVMRMWNFDHSPGR